MYEWEKNIRNIEPYVPGEQPKIPNIIKLNTNENPYPPARSLNLILREFNIGNLKLYPDTSASPLREKLAEYYNVSNEQVFIGVGSDDVLAMSFLTFFNSDKPILFPDITYSFYKVWAELFNIKYETLKLDEEFNIIKEDYFKDNGGIVIANPNAPTSIAVDTKFIEDILQKNKKSVVIVDEAYIDFGGKSMLPFVNKYDNLLVVQTFSKSRSMAGMRIGFAIGNKTLISALNAVKNSYNSYTMSSLAITLGCEVLKDKEYFAECCSKIIDTRQRTILELEKIGFICMNSCTNFIFAKHKSIYAADIFEALKARNIFVRYFNSKRIDNYLRITVGTNEEMNTLIKALEEIVC